MRCPFCQRRESRVVDSRTGESEIRRRRECEACNGRFTTYERVDGNALRVVKKDGRREPFLAEKVAAGVRSACEKRLDADQIEEIVAEVERQVRGLGQSEVSSHQIGDLVLEALHRRDPIAYVRFASLCRSFADLAALRQALDELEGRLALAT